MSELGEITDDDFDVYVPVARPDTSVERPPLVTSPKLPRSSSEDSVDRILPLPKPYEPPNKKKYNIWCSDADVLTDCLLDCGVDSELKERSVESYNYKLKYKVTEPLSSDGEYDDFDELMDETRRRRKGLNLRMKRNKKSHLLVPKKLVELTSTKDDSIDDVAADIAKCLEEPNKVLITTVVKVLGQAKAIDLFRKTKEIENQGGMLILDQSRRRTSGGIFFFLLRGDSEVTWEEVTEIFESEKAGTRHRQRKRRRRKVKSSASTEKSAEVEAGEIVDGSNDEQHDELTHSPDQLPLENPPPSPATDVEPGVTKNNGNDGFDENMDL